MKNTEGNGIAKGASSPRRDAIVHESFSSVSSGIHL